MPFRSALHTQELFPLPICFPRASGFCFCLCDLIVQSLTKGSLVQGVEATLFATLMSILNGGGFLGSFLGGVLTSWFGVTADNFDNLAMLVLVCTVLSLAPLPLLRLVPESTPLKDLQKK